MGSAYVAVADDASSTYWNPAGLVGADQRGVLLSHQPLSLDRQHDSLSFALSLREEVGFGITWLHAGVDGITARSAGGSPVGNIDDATNVFLVSVGRAIGSRFAAGVTLKVVNQEIVATGRSISSTGKGSGFDLGLLIDLNDQTRVGAVLRNLNTDLSWKVDRGTGQAGTLKNPLPTTAVVGASYRPLPKLLVAGDLSTDNVDTHLNLGTELSVNPALTVRAGLHRLPGDDAGIGSGTAGLTLRPMRRENAQVPLRLRHRRTGRRQPVRSWPGSSLLMSTRHLPLFLLFAIWAATDAAAAGLPFLRVSAGARGAALAEAVVGVSDPLAIFYNPAAMPLERESVAFTHTEWIQEIHHEYVAATRGSEAAVIGLGLQISQAPDLEFRSGPTNEALGTFGVYEGALNLAYARRFDEQLSAGANFKLIRQSIYTETASGIGVDLGLLFRLHPSVQLAATARKYWSDE